MDPDGELSARRRIHGWFRASCNGREPKPTSPAPQAVPKQSLTLAQGLAVTPTAPQRRPEGCSDPRRIVASSWTRSSSPPIPCLL